MRDEAWISDEPRVGAIAARVFARARRRPWRVLALALLATGALVARRALKEPAYQASLHFRLAEGDLVDPALAPRPPRDVRGEIMAVALSRQRLAAIMEKHGVSAAWLARDPIAAVDDFREQLAVEVTRNYFVEDRHRRSEPRSAFVTVSVVGSDAEQARALLHDLGEAVLQHQGAGRAGSLADARGTLDAQVAQAREHTRALQEEMARLAGEARRADSRTAVDLRARIAALEIEALGSIERVLALERRADAVGFSGAAEGEALGLSFRLLDEDLAILSPPLEPLGLALRAVALFSIASVLAAAAVGAFDDRIYASEDLRARGLPVFGAVSAFPGDDAGSYRARAPARRAGGTS